MDKKGRLSHLGAKLVGMSVLGLVLAFAVFYLLDGVVTPWLLYSERFAPFWLRRNAALIQTYQDYVTENDLTVQQVVDDREGRLQAMGEGIYTIVVGTPSVVEFPVKAMEPSALPDDASYHFSYSTVVGFTSSSPANDSVEFLAELHQIQCADGVLFVSNSPMIQRYEGVGRLTGLLLALACFCVVVVPYIVRLLRRIGALSREAEILMAGDLEHSIHVEGRDELSGLGEDIERLRRSVLERIQGEREAVAANSRLITSMSHDLRTPLTAICGYLDLLRQTELPADAVRYLDIVEERVDVLRQLTEELFGYSAAVSVTSDSRGDLYEDISEISLNTVLEEILSAYYAALKKRRITPAVTMPEETVIRRLNKSSLSRVFGNIISNALKYSDGDLEITLSAQGEIVFANHAAALDELQVMKLFDRYYTVENAVGATGLGLSIARELTVQMGGTIEAQYRDGMLRICICFEEIF